MIAVTKELFVSTVYSTGNQFELLQETSIVSLLFSDIEKEEGNFQVAVNVSSVLELLLSLPPPPPHPLSAAAVRIDRLMVIHLYIQGSFRMPY